MHRALAVHHLKWTQAITNSRNVIVLFSLLSISHFQFVMHLEALCVCACFAVSFSFIYDSSSVRFLCLQCTFQWIFFPFSACFLIHFRLSRTLQSHSLRTFKHISILGNCPKFSLLPILCRVFSLSLPSVHLCALFVQT